MNDEPEFGGLVEHFFRHEYGRLTAVLARRFGVAHLETIEDAVQTALMRALQAWRQRGVPRRPAAWLTRAAVNATIDLLRRKGVERRVMDELESDALDSDRLGAEDPTLHDADSESTLSDEPLRLLFLCCHPDIPLESRVALALRTVSGFSTDEVAAVLLITKANAEKRVTRAKEGLRSIGMELSHLGLDELKARLPAVQATIYLLFTEGYASTAADVVLRRDLCDEAIRLAGMLVSLPELDQAGSAALVALMLFHSARFDARIDSGGASVLLEEQDRTRWDWSRIREAMAWMQRSAVGDSLTRYHVESAIAWEHCRASGTSETDWRRIAELYGVLCRTADGPMVRLNHAIAIGYALGPQAGLNALVAIGDDNRKRLRPWWDCAIADAYRRCGRMQEAEGHLRDALNLSINSSRREVIERKLQELTGPS